MSARPTAAGVRYNASPVTAALMLITGVSYGIAFIEGTLLAHLIGAILLAFMGLSYALARRSLDGVTITRALPSTAFDGDDVEVHFTLANTDRSRRSLVEIVNEYYAPQIPPGQVTALVLDLAPGASASTSAAIPDLRRGEYAFPPPALVSGDPFGLFTVRRELDESEFPTSRLTVFPRPFPIEYLPIASYLSRSISGLEPTNQAGVTGDFLGTREYRPGDSVRAIHWPLSARMGELIVKEFERNASTEVSIFLDLDARAAWGSGREHTLEYAARIAASVADYAARRGNAIHFVGHTTRWVVMPPGKGAYHQRVLMHFLASVQATGSVPFHHVIRRVAPQLREGSTAVVIFPSQHLQLEMFEPALESLWARRVRVIAVVLDADSFATPRRKSAPPLTPAVQYLASRGAAVYLVTCGGDLSRQLSVQL